MEPILPPAMIVVIGAGHVGAAFAFALLRSGMAVDLLLIAWVWIGRIVFGVGGWFFLVFLISVVPVLLLAFLVTTVLAYTQPGRPRAP